MARFNYIVQHVPGKLLYTADTLSRAPVDTEGEETTISSSLCGQYYTVTTSDITAIGNLPKSPSGGLCSKVIEYCRSSWPEKHALDISITPYWKIECSNIVPSIQETRKEYTTQELRTKKNKNRKIGQQVI